MTDDLGRVGVGEAAVVVAGDMKLGAYDVAFVDAEWHSSVTRISLLRSYSTLRKDTVGDFGHGWRLSMLDMRVQRNGPLGDGGWRQEACGSGFLYYPVCTVTDAPHVVVVRWPDGTVEAFDLTPDEGSSYFSDVMTVSFTGRPGATSTLTPVDASTAVYVSGDLYATLAANELYDPQQYWLTDRTGVMYLLDIDEGLLETVDRNGNRVVYTDDGIFPDRGIGVGFVRDAAGRIERVDLADGSSIAYGYDANGDLVRVTDQLGDVTEFTYHAHRLTAYSDAGHEPVAVLTYDADGRLVEQVDPLGVLVATDADLDSYTQTVVGPDPRLVTTMTYDQDGQLVQVVEAFDGVERMHTWEYDEDFRVIRAVSPSGAEQTFAYDDAGRVTAATDPDGVVTEWVYDEDGDVLSVYVDGELKRETIYDAAGNALTELSATGEVLFTHTYDTWGGPLTWTDADGGAGEVLYDGADQVRGFVVNGRTVQFGLDAFGRGVSFSDAVGEYGTAVYDDRGKVTEFTDASGHVQRWTYDERGFLVSRTDKAARTSSFVYADDGSILQETTRAGDVLTFAYDEAGRLARVDGGDVWVAYTYDALGRLTGVANDEQVVTFAYDIDGNMISEEVVPVEPDAWPTLETTYTWTVAGRLARVDNGVGVRTFSYDGQGRVVTLEDSRVGATAFAWNADDLLVAVERSTGVRTELAYSPGQRLIGIETSDAGVVIEDQVLVRDEDGRVTSRVDGLGEHTYTYDARGQLTDATHPEASGLDDEAYDFDANGNRTDSIRGGIATFDADLLVEDDAYAYTYDREGRLATRIDRATLEETTFHWDAFDQLRRIAWADGTETTFAYDGLGRRIELVHRGEVTRFGYDGDEVRVTFDVDNRVVTWLSTDPAGGLLAEWNAATGAVREAITDQLGSRTGWLSGEGVERTPRDSFGNPVSAPERVEPHAFTWHAQDPTGLVYARARYLDPRTGRFLSEDPLEAGNLYTYAGNNPVGRWDPYGEMAIQDAKLRKYSRGRTAASARRVGVRVACMISQAAEVAEVLGVAINAGAGAVTVVADMACSASGGGACFVAGTGVATPDGTIAIEEVREGDLVRAWGPSGEAVARVRQTFTRPARELIDARIRFPSGTTEVLSATPDHPFYVPTHRGFVDLGELEPGAVLSMPDGGEASIETKTIRYGNFTVHNFDVEAPHNYFVGANWDGDGDECVLVHNAKCNPWQKSGAYEIRFGNGKVYCGKGRLRRATLSAFARLKLGQGGVGPPQISWQNAGSWAEAYILEALCIERNGGLQGGRLLNSINSPGAPLLGALRGRFF